eukprot:6104939-Amphidinium_carterae.1
MLWECAVVRHPERARWWHQVERGPVCLQARAMPNEDYGWPTSPRELAGYYRYVVATLDLWLPYAQLDWGERDDQHAPPEL